MDTDNTHMTETDVEELIQELFEASEAYYLSSNENSSPLTDDEFDQKFEFLETLKNSGNYQNLFQEGSKGYKLFNDSVSLGAEIETDTVFTHRVKMLSLKKAKTEEELKKFLNRMSENGAENFNLQAKLDGFALSTHYENGEIKRLVTRGDGEKGEDVSYLLKDSKITIVNLPEKIDDESVTEIRGEIFFTDEQFEEVNKRYEKVTGKSYKNSRNAVVGLMSKSRIGVEFDVEFTMGIYSAWRGIDYVNMNDLNLTTVSDLTKDQVGDLSISNLSLSETLTNVEKFGKLRENFSIPTDGVVIKPTNDEELMKKLGNSSTYPNHHIAFKYPGESAETTIVDVTFSVGRTGKINPIGRLNPVFLNGTTISNVSLHNFKWISEKNLKIGSIVSIVRANDVIPYVKAVILNPDDSKNIEIPENCPSCGERLSYEGDEYPPMTLKCENHDCPAKNFNSVKAAVSKGILDIDGMSISTVEALHESGKVNDIADIYSLTLEDLSESQYGVNSKGNSLKLGDKRAEKIFKEIQKARRIPLNRFLMALSITGIGNSVSKDLVKNFGTLENILEASENDFNNIEGIGETISRNIADGLERKKSLIDKLLSSGVVIEDESVKVSSNSTDKKQSEKNPLIDGKSFSISGNVPEMFSNRNEFVEFIEANGGEFHSSPKKNTDYFIGDSDGSSSKIKKAISLEIEFVKSENFSNFFKV